MSLPSVVLEISIAFVSVTVAYKIDALNSFIMSSLIFLMYTHGNLHITSELGDFSLSFSSKSDSAVNEILKNW